MDTKPDIVGMEDVAEMLGVQLQTCHRWRVRPETGFPEPEWVISRTPIWQRKTILRWARQTGRITPDGPQKVVNQQARVAGPRRRRTTADVPAQPSAAEQ